MTRSLQAIAADMRAMAQMLLDGATEIEAAAASSGVDFSRLAALLGQGGGAPAQAPFGLTAEPPTVIPPRPPHPNKGKTLRLAPPLSPEQRQEAKDWWEALPEEARTLEAIRAWAGERGVNPVSLSATVRNNRVAQLERKALKPSLNG